jgi:hypothetical protein
MASYMLFIHSITPTLRPFLLIIYQNVSLYLCNQKSIPNTYLLTPWSRVLLEKLTVNFAASQEIPRIYGNRKFLTVTTSARHLYLS